MLDAAAGLWTAANVVAEGKRGRPVRLSEGRVEVERRQEDETAAEGRKHRTTVQEMQCLSGGRGEGSVRTTGLVRTICHFILVAGAGSVCIAVARFHMILLHAAWSSTDHPLDTSSSFLRPANWARALPYQRLAPVRTQAVPNTPA